MAEIAVPVAQASRRRSAMARQARLLVLVASRNQNFRAALPANSEPVRLGGPPALNPQLSTLNFPSIPHSCRACRAFLTDSSRRLVAPKLPSEGGSRSNAPDAPTLHVPDSALPAVIPM